MNIHITYNRDDYAADVFKIAYVRRELLYKYTYLIHGVGVLIAFNFILTGLFNENIIHESAKHHNNHHLAGFIFASAGIGFLLAILILFRARMLGKRKILKRAKRFEIDESAEINFSFTEEMVIYRDGKVYQERAWSGFSSYLVVGGFIFVCIDSLENSFAVSQKQLYKEQSDELITFLASKLPVWK